MFWLLLHLALCCGQISHDDVDVKDDGLKAKPIQFDHMHMLATAVACSPYFLCLIPNSHSTMFLVTLPQGYVANQIETEQITQDGSLSQMHKARLTSFVQLRGSLPSQWSQDISKIVPKPQILCELD